MDISRPLRAIAPTVDADVLGVLAVDGSHGLTGREVSRRASIPHSSAHLALHRLCASGLVTAHPAGRANLYLLNREHLLAGAVLEAADARARLIERLRTLVSRWEVPARVAMLFGSVARGDSGAGSDLDILVVPGEGAEHDDRWAAQLAELAARGFAWTGSETSILEIRWRDLKPSMDAVESAYREGIELVPGSRDALVEGRSGAR